MFNQAGDLENNFDDDLSDEAGEDLNLPENSLENSLLLNEKEKCESPEATSKTSQVTGRPIWKKKATKRKEPEQDTTKKKKKRTRIHGCCNRNGRTDKC